MSEWNFCGSLKNHEPYRVNVACGDCKLSFMNDTGIYGQARCPRCGLVMAVYTNEMIEECGFPEAFPVRFQTYQNTHLKDDFIHRAAQRQSEC